MKTHYSFFAALFALLFTLPFTAFGGKYETSITAFWNHVDNGNFDKAVMYLNADLQVFLPLSPTPLNREAYRQVGESFRTGFPDINHKVMEVTEGKMTAAVRGTFLGTNTGSLMGNPPTGNRVELPFLQYWTFDETGKAVRIEISFDLAAFNAQLMKGIPTAINKATELALKMMAHVSAHDLDGVIQYCAADARFNGWGPEVLDSKGYRHTMSEILASFPDAAFTVSDVVSESDKVVVRHQLEGTHTGVEFQGVPTSNRKIKVSATITFYFEKGKAQELWLNADMLGMLMQLGAKPFVKN